MSSGQLTTEEKDRLPEFAEKIRLLRERLHRRIVGQEDVLTLVLAGILAEGHCLLVGVPGLAKTLLISSLAELLSVGFKRIQFTPDLMPSDVTGSSVIRDDGHGARAFHFLKGPVFTNIVLADEINRTPPKTQAALIEAMEERQVSVAGHHTPLDRPFFVLATQNPIEQEGTYPLPVTQMDRFLFRIDLDYPEDADEYRMLVLTTSTYRAPLEPVMDKAELTAMLDAVQRIELSEDTLTYAANIVRGTRPDEDVAPATVKDSVSWGAGPRATQALLAGARAMALLDGRSFVKDGDIHQVVVPTLRHRILLRYHAQAEGLTTDAVVVDILRSLGRYQPTAEESPKKPFFSRLFG